MKEFDIEFTVHQQISYEMTVKAETPEQAIKLAQDPDFDRSDAEGETLLESFDDTDTISVLGERVTEKTGVASWREPFDSPIKAEPTPFQKYKKAMGNLCPVCESTHITERMPFNADGLEAWRDIECLECGETWRELFTMQNIDIL